MEKWKTSFSIWLTSKKRNISSVDRESQNFGLFHFYPCRKFSCDFEAFNFQWIFLSFIMHFSISVLHCTDHFFFYSEKFPIKLSHFTRSIYFGYFVKRIKLLFGNRDWNWFSNGLHSLDFNVCILTLGSRKWVSIWSQYLISNSSFVLWEVTIHVDIWSFWKFFVT